MKLHRHLSILLLVTVLLLAACGPAPKPDTSQIDIVLTEGVQTMVASYFETQTALAPTATATIPTPTSTVTPAFTPVGFLSTQPPLQTATLVWIPILPSSTSTVTGTPPTALPTTLASGCNNLALVSGPVVSPVEDFLTGTDVNVSWEVRNSGSCDWKANYFIQQVGGPCPEGEIVGGAPDRAIPSGNKGTISAKIELPRQSGSITCSYRLSDGSKLFGATLSMTVTVKKPVLGYP